MIAVLALALWANGQAREIPDESFRGGELSGILRSRQEVMDPAYQKLNKLALVFATKFNEVHSKGYDANGNTGKDSLKLVKALLLATLIIVVKQTLISVIAMCLKSQVITTKCALTAMNGMSHVCQKVLMFLDSNTAGTLKFDGLEIKISNSTGMSKGDSFLVKPVSGVINGMQTLVSNASDFAAAGSKDSGPGDNENIKQLVKLQDEKLIDGSSTFSDFYATLVNDVGSKTKQAQIDSETQNKMTESFYEQEQAISGVNMNEESIQMQKIQQFSMPMHKY